MGRATLGNQIAALLTQGTDAVFEIVVVDNGSTDGTTCLLRSFMSDPRVRLVRAPDVTGVNWARNVGVCAARGQSCCCVTPTLSCTRGGSMLTGGRSSLARRTSVVVWTESSTVVRCCRANGSCTDR